MDSEPRINRMLNGKTRKEVCDKIALDFMDRQAPALANHMSVRLAQERKVQDALITMYAKGHLDGFSMALELLLSGALNLQEIQTEIPDSEQAREKGGTDGTDL